MPSGICEVNSLPLTAAYKPRAYTSSEGVLGGFLNGGGGEAISKRAHDRNEKSASNPGGTPLLEANRDVPLDGVEFSRLR